MATSQGATTPRTDPAVSAEQMNTYFIELEAALERIERSTTHYQTLNVERLASQDEIKQAFDAAAGMLYPPYVISSGLPEAMLTRVDRCFNKSSLAFSVLASFKGRRDYDAALLSIAATAPPDRQKSGRQAQPARSAPRPVPVSQDEEISISRMPSQKEVFSEFSKGSTSDNRRRAERFRLAIPVRVVGFDRKNGKWQEMAETIDVSRTGANIRLRKSVRHGTVLYVTLPLPQKLRGHGFADPAYKVYALVRRVEPPKKGVRVLGLEFLGEHPPSGFLDKPWAIFRTRRWAGSERRRAPRHERSEVVRIEYLSESMQSILREEARTENISRTGLRIAVKLAPADFDLVRVSCARRDFECFATLRNRFVAKDGLERLCVQLVDKQWPV
jgi:hypothetical protein